MEGAGAVLRLESDKALGEAGFERWRNARQRFLEEFESSRAAKKQADWLEGLVRKARGRDS